MGNSQPPRGAGSNDPALQLLDALPVFASFIDRDERYQLVNHAYEEWFGQPREAILGKTVREVLGEEGYAGRKAHIEAALRGERVQFETFTPGPDGSHRITEMEYLPRFGPDGQPDGFHILATDVTERNRGERALRESEARLRIALDAARMAVWEFDVGTEELRGPSDLNRIFGFPEDRPLNIQDVRSRYYPGERERLVATVQAALARGERYSEAEFRYLWPDGSIRWLMLRAEIHLKRDGTPDRYIGVLQDITEHKHAEDALRRSEALKGAILNAALDCIITITKDSFIHEWNAAAERIFGFAREYALGRDLTDLIIPAEHREAHRRGMAHYLATGEGPVLDNRIEIDAIRANGSRFPVELAISAIHIGGKPYFTAYLRDITDRKLAEAARQETEQRLRATYEHAFVGIAEVDSNGRFLRVNEQFCAITGYERDELLSRTYLDITHPDDRAHDFEQFDRQMAGDVDTYIIEKRYIHKNGHVVWIELSASKVNNAVGQPLYGVRVVRDITASRHAERANARLAAVVSSSPDAIISLAADDGRILTWNKGAEALFGYRQEEAIGGPVSLLVPPEHLTKVEDETGVFSRVMAEGQVQVETVRRRKDGSLVDVSVSAARMTDAWGRVLGVSAIFRDITDRKRWEEHQRLLINELNHRVKNTLATVQSIASQTLRTASTTSDARAAIEQRLLALSRVHDVLTRENWEGANLREIVANAVEPFRPAAGHRIFWEGAQIRLSPRMALAIAMALQELATNAIKYGALSNLEGVVHVSWTVADEDDPSRLRLTWVEQGGPPVSAPTRKGFGSRLIERGLAQDLNGTASIDYRREGVVCTVDAPIA